jgi:peptidoglycan/xylan/chitin deacetylase (PgdA/CDA1 family)
MRPTVLAYHTVVRSPVVDDPHGLAVSADVFAAQLDLLAAAGSVVPLADVVSGAARRGSVALTFDDGYRGVLEVAAPLLAERGLPATLFVPTGHLGERNRWDDLHDPAFRIVELDELGALEVLGVAVESHGHGHISYVSSATLDIRTDVDESTEVLSAALGRAPRFLAYPFGPCSSAAQNVVRLRGYEAAFTIDLRHAGSFAWGRVAVQPGDSLQKFRLKASGWWEPVRRHPLVDVAAAVSRPFRRR